MDLVGGLNVGSEGGGIKDAVSPSDCCVVSQTKIIYVQLLPLLVMKWLVYGGFPIGLSLTYFGGQQGWGHGWSASIWAHLGWLSRGSPNLINYLLFPPGMSLHVLMEMAQAQETLPCD